MSEKKNTSSALIYAAVAVGALAVGAAAYILTQPKPKPRPAAAEAPKVAKKKKKPTETSTDETPSARPAEAAAAKASPTPTAAAKAAPAPTPAPTPAAKSAPAPAPAPSPAPTPSPKASPAPAPTPKAAPAPAPASPAATAPAAAPSSPVASRQQTFIIMCRGDIGVGVNEDTRTPLSDSGRRTIRDNVTALASHGITRIESSPHLACLQSAEEAAKALGLAPGCIHVNAGLANVSQPGPKPSYPTPEEANAAIPGGLVDIHHPWATEPARHPETTDDANKRFWETFIALDKACLAENVLVITHDLALYRIAQHVRANPTEIIYGASAGDYIIATREIRGASAQPWACAVMAGTIESANYD